MQWTDEGIVLGVRRYGESSVILELMTQGAAGILGWCAAAPGGGCARCCSRAIHCVATWRARLDDHLGYYAVEGTQSARG